MTHDHAHVHHEGSITAARCDHHPEPPDSGAAISSCGICGAGVWILPKTQIFLGFHPHTPVLCCYCTTNFKNFLEAVNGEGRGWSLEDVPDLRYLCN